MKFHAESVERVITAMKGGLGRSFTLAAMARIACFSPYHFIRTFRQVTGVLPSQFLCALRLERARQLLMHTPLKVADICRDVGYQSIGTFTRRFTGLIGIPPTTLRELARSTPRQLFPRSTDSFPAGKSKGAGRSLAGQVSMPASFNGMIFVGLFENRIPQSRPVACAIADADGLYLMEDLPEGEFYLFGLGLRYPIEPPGSFDYESALRGGGQAVRISPDWIYGSTDLQLRPPLSIDPPILLVLPVLIDKYVAEQAAFAAADDGNILAEAQSASRFATRSRSISESLGRQRIRN